MKAAKKMATTILRLGIDDVKARSHIINSLEVCAFDHVLSRLLLTQFLTTQGDAIAIVGDWYNLAEMATYDYVVSAPANSRPYAEGDRPREHLISFLKSFLETTPSGIVISENWGWNRADVPKQVWPPKRVSYFDDDVYHILDVDLADDDSIERAVVPRHHWQTT
ncbi:MAG: hypothetical protein ABI557_19035, partial [Aureliella sp.]